MASPRLPYPELKSNRLGFPDSSTPAMNSSRLADGIEHKILEFDVDILDAVFNKPGRYFVKMTIQSLATKDYSKILLRKWPDESFVRDYEAVTSVVNQKGSENEPELCVFEDKKFTYRLPAGFCKHDRNHDVYLLLEAFDLPANSQDMGKKVGEGKVAIYPRTNAPRTNHNVNPGEDMYRHTQVVALLRTTSKQGKAEMHCGRMRCNFALKEYNDEAERKKKKEEEERKREEEERREAARREEEERKRREEEDRRRREIEEHREAERRREEEEEKERKRLEQEAKLKETENPFQKDAFQARPKVARTPGPHDRPTQPAAAPFRGHSPVSEWGDNTSINLPVTPSPSPPAQDLRKTGDSPLRDYDKTTYSSNQTWRHTSKPGHDQIDVIVHGASNLPSAAGGKTPQPFVTVKTRKDVDMNRKARSRTHAVARPTNIPSWEELMTLELTDKEAEKEVMVITVDDAITKGQLINYSIPIANLQPFHPYHIEMVMPAKGGQEGVKLYASIMRKASALPKDPSSPNYLALEVFLRGVKLPLQNPVGPLIAVARIVPDYYNYKSDNLLTQPRAAGVTMSSITFPNPHPNTFTVVGRSSHGYPQVSLLGRPEEQPKWNHPYLFCDTKDKATMFTPTAALVIEYYVANTAMTDEFWKIRSPVGFSSLLLDQKVYKQLSQEKAKMGMRVEGVPIMGSELRMSDGRAPLIGMVLKLITTHQPDSMVTMSNLENLPSMELREGLSTAPHTADVLQIRTPSPEVQPKEGPSEEKQGGEEEEEEENLAPGMYLQRVDKNRLPIKDGELPPFEAMEYILPEYQYIFVDPNQNTDRSTKSKPPPPSRHVQPPDRGAYTTTTAATRDPNDLDQTQMNLLDYQMRDLDNYRTAVQKMGQDILALRTQVRQLEGENSKLRIDVNHYDDNRKLLIDAADLDSLARPELQARYASLRQKLAAQTTELKDYKTKVQKLQNELIKKNDKEKDYLKMSHAHASQQELLQRLQEKVQKVRKLEETCKKQEKVIEKLEAVLYKMRGKPNKDGAMNEVNAALVDENKRLRELVDDMKDQMARAGAGGGEDLEKLELYQALERAEGRIMSLEKQLQENARSWGKERADLSIRVNEAEHGFGRSGGMILHDYPVLDSAYGRSYTVPSRLGPLLR
ncbi:coiled-coil domain-containing protein 33-like [Physella acuta]|uniref:coiled-coil domain-containing protein 33-like n=1 Tax=Physella acuta TaxID=109671 RepID=UPI0027DC575C|nr:coiled-coil domain-containing protein 33-like [Physella acuta]